MKKNLYRNRLKTPLSEKVLDFLSSMEDDVWIAEEDIIGTEVHNIMLYEQKILNRDEIKSILTSLETIREKIISSNIEIDKDFEDIHPFIENCVISDIGMEIGGKLHTGRSRNDQVSVDIRLKIRNELNVLTKKLLELIQVLLKVSQKTISSYMPLYTHLQRGQLGVLAHYINNYIAQIIRNLERIEEVYSRINKNPLGACAIGGTSININRMRTAELLGFDGIIENSIDAVSSRDYILETLICLFLISIQFTRIAEDLLIWSTNEFQFIELEDQYCSVSSVMPQKKNNDTLELIRSKASKVISNLFSATMIIKGIPSGYFRDFQELKPLLKDSFKVLNSIIEIFIGIFNTIKVNEHFMVKAVNESYILALDLAESLVQRFNIPFRISHKIVANLVKESNNPQELLDRNRIEDSILKIYGQAIELPSDFIESIQNLELCLEKRISQGSPSIIQIKYVIKSLTKQRELIKSKYLNRTDKINEATKYRQDLIKKLIS
ncbi:MAG: argininosuccinate lyase [Promethearchaeota archaeon]|nr:MAG: argininosuccinate lyase [Candidatus Lokiarchaeota archaeon]